MRRLSMYVSQQRYRFYFFQLFFLSPPLYRSPGSYEQDKESNTNSDDGADCECSSPPPPSPPASAFIESADSYSQPSRTIPSLLDASLLESRPTLSRDTASEASSAAPGTSTQSSPGVHCSNDTTPLPMDPFLPACEEKPQPVRWYVCPQSGRMLEGQTDTPRDTTCKAGGMLLCNDETTGANDGLDNALPQRNGLPTTYIENDAEAPIVVIVPSAGDASLR